MLQPLRDLPLLRDTYQEGKTDGRTEGETRGQTNSLLVVLSERGMSLTEAQRQKILACQDVQRLLTWLKRAVLARSIEEVLD